jgi:hypothetical protein
MQEQRHSCSLVCQQQQQLQQEARHHQLQHLLLATQWTACPCHTVCVACVLTCCMTVSLHTYLVHRQQWFGPSMQAGRSLPQAAAAALGAFGSPCCPPA